MRYIISIVIYFIVFFSLMWLWTIGANMFNQPDTLSFIVGIIVLSSVGLSFIAGAISLGILAMRKIHSGIESVMEKGENDEESK